MLPAHKRAAPTTNKTTAICLTMPILPNFDCSVFPQGSRMWAICAGTSGLPEFGPGNTRESYLRLWAGQPPLPPIGEVTDLSCIHRGEHLDWVPCPTCQT